MDLATVERETRGFWEGFARRGGGEVWSERGLTMFRTGLPLANYNGVIAAQIAPEDADARIAEAVASFAPLPMKWLVMPGSRPEDLSARLSRAGFVVRDSPVLMARPLAGLPREGAPAGIVFERVADDAAFDEWVQLSFPAPREPGSAHDCVWRAHRPIWKSDDHAYFLARRDGRVVARSLLRVTDGFAGLYGVFTAESERGRGLGRAVTLIALDEGRRLGLGHAILQASVLGLPVYQKLGFASLGVMHSWERSAPAARGESPSAARAPPR